MAEANVKIGTTLLNGLIAGRVEPHIYAFSTETIPNYLKVGDTARGVRVRLDEWRKIFPNLVKQYEHSAQIDEETMFRDFAVHFFLEHEKGRIRLRPGTFDNLPYYSNEFFEAATRADLDEAMKDIQLSAKKKSGKYRFYSLDRLPQTFIYERKDCYAPRGNQQQVIDNFKAAVDAGRRNLLMYAVMRFGKSFTSMCCAKEMDAKIVAIVTAKADVREEWKKTVESHVRFAGYKFLDSESLRAGETAVADTLASGENAVLFLTLQDLQGNKMKSKHKEVFEHEIDLLIIDETHFGARGESYGKVLREQNLKQTEISKELKKLNGFETLDQVEEAVKLLKARIRLHLSGTPYRILMSDEFQKEDIIAFVQFTDIVDAQKQWDEQHLKEDDCEEWDNPYYGFPQMLRFAFNPNESSRRKMEELRREGVTYALSELFRPCSIAPDAGNRHRQFKHEAEILDLLEVIDGTKDDENVLGFLDNDRIKEGKMCRHIVCVLPFRASCDAMAELIRRNKARFKNLGGYRIVNIAGFDDERDYKRTIDVIRAIEECEARDEKTLTLTVNRMLTGATVPQWDTMIYFKGTASPQEYDQAVFRLQNQYITTFRDSSGKIVRYNMKPQTLLVDFDPNRMFRLQELKSQFYNVNTDVQGNARLKERIGKELSVSPVIVVNKNRLQLVTPADITDAVREYSRNRNILDEASEISPDYALLQDEGVRKVIQGIAPIDARNGLRISPAKGGGDDIASPDEAAPEGGAGRGGDAETPGARPEDAGEGGKMEKRLAAYYARILFFAFLTESAVKSLEDVIAQISATEGGRRIAAHFGLDAGTLDLVLRKSNPFILRKLDYKIENVNELANDSSLKPVERVKAAMRKFVRLSESEIVTPEEIAREMVSVLPFGELDRKEDAKFLDIASKQGEFAVALYERFGGKVRDRLYAVPTSGPAYEFTRKVYSLLGMPVENIFAGFTSYDLIGDKKDEIIKKLEDMNFDVIISNPPYQIVNKGAGKGADPLYHLFMDAAMRIGEKSALIHPARFLFNAGKTPKDWNNSILNNPKFKVMKYWANSKDVFPVVDVDIKGGIAITYHDKKADFGSIGFFLAYEELSTILSKVKEKGEMPMSSIVGPRELYRITDRLYQEHPEMEGRQSVGHKYSLGANVFEVFPELFSDARIEDENEMAEIYGRAGSKRCSKWIKRSYITQPDNFEKYKVIIPKVNGTGAIGEVLSTPVVGMPVVGYTDTFIGVGVFDTEAEAKACLKYIKTKFARAMLGTLKITQDNTRETWANVPLQDFTSASGIDWCKSVAEIDAQLYAKYALTADEIAFIESMIKLME